MFSSFIQRVKVLTLIQREVFVSILCESFLFHSFMSVSVVSCRQRLTLPIHIQSVSEHSILHRKNFVSSQLNPPNCQSPFPPNIPVSQSICHYMLSVFLLDVILDVKDDGDDDDRLPLLCAYLSPAPLDMVMVESVGDY